MSDVAENRYVSQVVFTTSQLTGQGIAPSDAMRKTEADLAAELALMAHRDGQQFRGWPSFTLISEYDQLYLRDRFVLRAEVAAVKR